MPKFLLSGRYTPEGVRGVLKEGGSGRRAAVEKAVAGIGGTVESFYFSFGGTDSFVIADLPDNATAAALAMLISSSGAIGIETTVLLTPEELDEASQKSSEYRPPGG